MSTYSNTKGIMSAVFYGICSSSMVFLNKIILTTYGFNAPFLIMTLQMLISIIILEALRSQNILNIPAYTKERGRMFLFPSICYAINASLSLIALSGMNIPMYGVLKRCVPLVNLILSVVLLKKDVPPNLISISVVFITIGCIIAGIGDMSFSLWAYISGIISVLAQALYLSLVQKCAENHLSPSEILQLNSFNCFPMLLLMIFFTNEWKQIFTYQHYFSSGFLYMLFLVASMSCVLNYSLFLCTSLTSALTTSLVGSVKSILQTVVGIFTFDGITFHPLNALGIVLNIFGGLVYTYTKYQESIERKQIALDKLESESLMEKGEVS